MSVLVEMATVIRALGVVGDDGRAIAALMNAGFEVETIMSNLDEAQILAALPVVETKRAA